MQGDLTVNTKRELTVTLTEGETVKKLRNTMDHPDEERPREEACIQGHFDQVLPRVMEEGKVSLGRVEPGFVPERKRAVYSMYGVLNCCFL